MLHLRITVINVIIYLTFSLLRTLNFITQKICAFSVTFISASAFCGSSMFVCSFELFHVLSRSLNRDKENITLENNVLENFAENSLNNMNCF